MAKREVPGGDVGHLTQGIGCMPFTQYRRGDSQVCVLLGQSSLDELRVDVGFTELKSCIKDKCQKQKQCWWLSSNWGHAPLRGPEIYEVPQDFHAVQSHNTTTCMLIVSLHVFTKVLHPSSQHSNKSGHHIAAIQWGCHCQIGATEVGEVGNWWKGIGHAGRCESGRHGKS